MVKLEKVKKEREKKGEIERRKKKLFNNGDEGSASVAARVVANDSQ